MFLVKGFADPPRGLIPPDKDVWGKTEASRFGKPPTVSLLIVSASPNFGYEVIALKMLMKSLRITPALVYLGLLAGCRGVTPTWLAIRLQF